MRGHSYLMAGLMRTLGIQCIYELNLLNRLEKGAGEKKELQDSKTQVLVIIEALVDVMGRTIEPFIL